MKSSSLSSVRATPTTPKLRGKQVAKRERVQGGEELALRQVAGGAEDDERARLGRAREPEALEERVLRLALGREGHAGFSRWPPKACRMADRSRFANSASPREVKRSYSAADSTGAGTDSSIAALIVHRPSPESETRPA